MCVCVHTLMHVSVCVCVCTHACKRERDCMYMCMHTCAHCVCVCVCVCMCACECVYVCMRVCVSARILLSACGSIQLLIVRPFAGFINLLQLKLLAVKKHVTASFDVDKLLIIYGHP